jgi:GH25 family lysozyme M1 (1,4-beta-N-acetylmuramidase)
MIKGIDISRHQGAVNHDAIKRDVDFAIIRAGYGGGGLDDQFTRNRNGLRSRGVPLGFYFFAYPGRSSGRQQAEEFHRIVGNLAPGEFIALDIENETTYGRRLVPSDVQWSLEFLQRCEQLFGVKPLVYMDGGVKSSFNWQSVVNGNYGLWIAHWGRNNGNVDSEPNAAPWPFWAIHQYTSKANLGGIHLVDANLFNGTVIQLKKYGKQGGSAPAPKPAPKPQPSKPAGGTYTVKKGETLSSIAPRLGTTWQALYALNKSVIGADPDLIKPGQVLRLSGGPAPSISDQYYVVKKGDKLSKIGPRFGTPWRTIYNWNKSVIGSDPNKIFPGQRLRVK